MDKETMDWSDFYLFKFGFNQLINRLSFMRKSWFIVAVSTIEKQSREQTFKQSVEDMKSWYICDLLS